MSFHFLSHAWDVTNVDDGIMVTLSPHELDANTVAVLVDELVELVRECGQPNLYVDFGPVHVLAGIVFGKLITLNARLREMDCRLVLCNLDPLIFDAFAETRLTDNLDIRLSQEQPAGFEHMMVGASSR